MLSDTICEVRRGNLFYENTSSTFHKEADIAAAGGAGLETNVSGSEFGIPTLISTSLIGIDNLALAGINLTNFPVGIPRKNWDHGYTILHAMGMGSNSTVLNRLVETGQTASRVWSIFWGRMWNDNPIDGSLVLGGYDSEKVIGQSFENVTGTKTIGPSFGLHWSAALYDAKTVFTGDMVISFSSGLQVTVPNDQFMVPFMTIDRNGSRIFNDSQREFLFNPVLDHVQLPTLGRYCLTSAYLMVDHDAHTFTLWQENPSTTSQLVPLAGEKANTEPCTSTAGTAQPSQSKSLSSGIVAAIAVVSVVAAGLVALWMFYVFRARRKRKQAQLREAPVAAQESALKMNKNGLRQTRVYEMHSESPPHEVQGSEGMVYELEGRLLK